MKTIHAKLFSLRRNMTNIWLTLTFLNMYYVLCRADFTVSGRINIVEKGTVQNILQMKKYEIGDTVNFNFVLNFTGTKDLESIDIFISGSSMKFIWTLPNGGIYVEMQSEVVAGGTTLNPMQQQITPSEDKTVALIQLKNNFVPLKSASGRFVMKIQDMTNIRSILKVQTSVGRPTMIYSHPIQIFIPSFNVSHASPLLIGMKEKSTFQTNITWPLSVSNNCYVKLYMPYNENEAKMTVGDFLFSEVTGLDFSTTESIIGRLNSKMTRYSRSGTSEEDSATIELPAVNSTEGMREVATLSLKCEGILQDFIGFFPEESIEMGIAYKGDENFIWVGGTNVSISEPAVETYTERPILNVELAELTRTLEYGILNFKLRLTVFHDDTSNATAYNITVALHMPSSVKYVSSSNRYIDAVKRPNQIEAGDTVYFELPRVSFPHFSRVVFNSTIDTTSDSYESTDKFMIVYEVIYNGWRTEEEFSSSLNEFEFPIDRNTDDVKEFSTGSTCPCPWNENVKTCACCIKGGCQCGVQNPNKCVSCEDMYLCVDTIEGYYKSSFLQDLNGTTYACDDRSSARPGRVFASCMVRYESGEERVLSPFISVILGTDFDNAVLYGISNNGQGYIISYDFGNNWHSVPNSVYFAAVKIETFLNATIY